MRITKLNFPLYGIIAIIALILSEILMFKRIEPFYTLFTPIQWTFYILICDSIIFYKKKSSLITTYFDDFLTMLPISIFCWYIFEWYNLIFENWKYSGLPECKLLTWLGYAWSFATIFPGIFITADILTLFTPLSKITIKPFIISKNGKIIWFIVGVTLLSLPLIFQNEWMCPPVWLGFIFLLEPVNQLLSRDSLLNDLAQGKIGRIIILCISGIICGILWEFWNYWPGAKWEYFVPYWPWFKIFEMPFIGYLGFIPFAIECFCMYNFLHKSNYKVGLSN
ncbi:MAG: hypothetical protein AB1765_01260 [Candidatus Hydrogenedentota bacterium]